MSPLWFPRPELGRVMCYSRGAIRTCDVVRSHLSTASFPRRLRISVAPFVSPPGVAPICRFDGSVHGLRGGALRRDSQQAGQMVRLSSLRIRPALDWETSADSVAACRYR